MADCNTKIYQIVKKIPGNSKYITTQEFNKLTADNFDARLVKSKLGTKNDIANFVEKTDLGDKLKTVNKKVASNGTRHAKINK